MNRDTLARARALLFVPGHRPERFEKAVRAAGDAIVLDLEDAVAPEDKDRARDNVRRWLEAGGNAVVRINGRGTPWHDADVELAGRHDCGVMLPKAESPEDIAALIDRLPRGNGVVPLVETAAGIFGARRLCAAPGVTRPAFGSVDLAAQLGVDPGDRTALLHARSTLVLAAASAGVAAPWTVSPRMSRSTPPRWPTRNTRRAWDSPASCASTPGRSSRCARRSRRLPRPCDGPRRWWPPPAAG